MMQGSGNGQKNPKKLKWLKLFFRTRINALYRVISMLFTYKFLQLVNYFILPSAVSP